MRDNLNTMSDDELDVTTPVPTDDPVLDMPLDDIADGADDLGDDDDLGDEADTY